MKDAGVAAIPISAFYEEAPVTNLIRLCFPKRDTTLDEGATRLAKARELVGYEKMHLDAKKRMQDLYLSTGQTQLAAELDRQLGQSP